jgi:hypothetical protein
MHFHGAYFSNYSAWLNDPLHKTKFTTNLWSRILNGDVGGNFQGVHTCARPKEMCLNEIEDCEWIVVNIVSNYVICWLVPLIIKQLLN